MKLAACLTAAFAAGAMLLPGAASAAPQTAARTVTTTDYGRVTSRTTVRHSGNAWHGRTKWRTQCTTTWRHGRKYRTCRKVRVRW